MMKGIGRSQPVASTSAASLPPTGSSGSADSLGSTDASLKRLLDTDGADSGAGEDDADGRAAKVIKRGVKACTACRKVKMKCIASEPPESRCRRCTLGPYICLYIESQRGRHKTKTSDVVAEKLRKMQATLDSVLLRTIGATQPAPPPAEASITQFPIASLSPRTTLPALYHSPSSLNPHLLDAVSSELERYPSAGPEAFQSLNLLAGTPDGSELSAEQLSAHVSSHSQAKLRAGSFAGDPIKFPMQSLAAEPKQAPALLREKIVTVEDVKTLFDIFFTYLQPQAPFLDRDLHTPTYTSIHTPFLFTCIVTVASRYLPDRPGLYARCRATAIRLAADNVFSGLSSLSIVQGYLILAHWNQPGYPNEGDRAYLFSGTAVRMSLELGLHTKTDVKIPPGEMDELRIMLEKDARNRERTWIHCVVTDQSLSLQMGKPPIVTKEGYLTRHALSWSVHPLAIGSDIAIASIGELHKINAQTIDAFYSDGNSYTGMNDSVDYASLVRVYLSTTDHWRASTLSFLNSRDDGVDFNSTFNCTMTNLYYSYYRVFFLSFAIQHSQGKPHLDRDLNFYVVKGYECAVTFLKLVIERLGQTGRLRYGMDSTFVYVSYCACFVLKLIQPAFMTMIDPVEALTLARETATLLENTAVDSTHTPSIYAHFLRSLIDSKVAGTRAGTRAGSRAGSPADVDAPRLLPDLTASLQDILDANAADDAAMAVNATSDGLYDAGFWANMLMPGFGGRLGALSGGGAMLSDEQQFDGWGELGMYSTLEPPQPFSDFLFSAE